MRQNWEAKKSAYPIHSEASGGAHIGSSLGWSHQIDGDFRRDMFLNAPFAWACLPVRPGQEENAVKFLRSQQILIDGVEDTDKLAKQLRILRRAASKFLPGEVISLLSKPDQSRPSDPTTRDWLNNETLLATKDDELDEYLKKEIEHKRLKADMVYPIISVQENFSAIEGLAAEVLSFGDEPQDANASNNESNAGNGNAVTITNITLLIILILLVIICIKLL